ncbi:hypothetical protein C2857_003655 [Epichloe festucae Fl1]|uniref:Uncharacterized protein n=1 Tax=Epichloe festucae (strain Fl1) TaxID=877507 RepID=A0A7U3SN98_EPIFF|nr:hypothetical protein C2857_003655 [Epichloe festucae Fl1]
MDMQLSPSQALASWGLAGIVVCFKIPLDRPLFTVYLGILPGLWSLQFTETELIWASGRWQIHSEDTLLARVNFPQEILLEALYKAASFKFSLVEEGGGGPWCTVLRHGLPAPEPTNCAIS